MRRLPLLSLVAAVCGAAILGSGAQEGAGWTPRELREMLEQLQKYRKQLNARYASQHEIAGRAFREAAGSDVKAYDFFLKCTKEMRFTREGKREEAWRTWRDQNIEWLRSQEHMAARKLQLEYLILTLQAAQADDVKPLLPKLTDLLKQAAALPADTHRYLRESVDRCVFAETYELENTLDGEAWEMVPLNIDSVFEKVILPVYRNPGDPSLPRAWEERIDLQVKISEQRKKRQDRINLDKEQDQRRRPEANSEAFDFEKFEKETLPELKWAMAEDLYKYGFQKRAVQGMLAVLTAHPEHRNVKQWLSAVSKVLTDELEKLQPSAGATAAAAPEADEPADTETP